jgi:hypothetical protein
MRRITCWLLPAFFAAIATAQPAPDPLDFCSQKADPTERLACFDQAARLHRRAAAPAAAATTAPAVPSTTAPAAHSGPSAPVDPNQGLAGAQLRKRQREQGVVATQPKPLVATVARATMHPDHEYTFVLDNGQVWEQMENVPGLYVRDHESVEISPGVLGAFFLKTSGNRSVRVRRVY